MQPRLRGLPRTYASLEGFDRVSLPRIDAVRLLEGCRSDELATRTAAFERLGALLHRIALARLRARPQLAEDCAQEALVTIWRHLEAGRGPDDPRRFVSWSARIVVNKVLDAVRQREPGTGSRRGKRVAQSKQSSLDATHGDDGRSLGETLAADLPEADERAAIVDLRRAIDSLAGVPGVSERSRVVLSRGFLEGLEDEELAALLGTTRANVHVIRCRDIAKLREDPSFMDRIGALHAG